jgi:hypothetical protein
VDFPQGIGFFRWAFDPVARALRKFPDAEQQPTLEAIGAFRKVIEHTAHLVYQEFRRGRYRSTLNDALVSRINAATTVDAVRAWVEAATVVGRGLGSEKLSRAQFEALADHALRLRREGVAFEVTLTPEWGSGETIQLIPADSPRLVEALPGEVVKALGKFSHQEQAALAGRIEALRQQVKARPVRVGYYAQLSANPDMIQTVTGLLADSADFADAQTRIEAFGELLLRIDAAPGQIKMLEWGQVPVWDLTRRIARLAAAGIPFELTLTPEWGSTETLQLAPRDPAYAAEAVPQGVVQAVGKFPSSTRQALVLARLM